MVALLVFTGIVLTIVTKTVQVRRLGNALHPVFLGALVVILVNISHLLEAFEIIFASAFTPRALGGALIGISVQKTLSLGVSRGVLPKLNRITFISRISC